MEKQPQTNQPRQEPAPLFLIAIPFAAGIFWARRLHGLGPVDYLWLCSTFLFGLFFFHYCLVSDDASEGFPLGRKYMVCITACVTVLFFTGFCHERYHEGLLERNSRQLSRLAETGGEYIFSGIIVDAPVPANDGCRSRVLVNFLERTGKSSRVRELMAVTFKGLSWQDLGPGTSVRFAASLRKVRNFKTPGTFDYENWWALRGIRIKGYCSSPMKVTVLPADPGMVPGINRLDVQIQVFRHAVMRAASKFFKKEDNRAVALGLLTGERAWFGKDLREGFAASGLGHLLAVSGLHMAIVALFAGGAVRLLLGLSQWALLNLNVRLVSSASAVLACLMYTALAGFSPSSLRAFFMVLCIGTAFFMERSFAPKNSTALAAMILLVFDPFYLFDVSFQLSFFVVFFLIHLFESIDLSNKTFRSKTVKLLLLSVSSFLFAAPLVAFYFQRFSITAIPLNLLAVPLTEFFILPLLLLGLLASWIVNGAAGLFWCPAAHGVAILTGMVRHVADFEWVRAYVLPPSIGQVCLATVLFLLLPVALYKRSFKKLALCAALLLAFLGLFNVIGKRLRPGLVFHLVDVGQGLCQVVELPDGKILVSDTGGARFFDMGKKVVAPYLRRLGVRRIDILALSHPEQDHAGGAPALLRQFDVGEVWLNTDDNPALSAWSELSNLALERHVPVIRWKDPSLVFLGRGAEIEVLPCTKCPVGLSRNARCLVFRLGYRGRHVLMTGDMDTWREERIVSSHEVRSEVMVIPHHGSRSSSSLSFIQAVSPSVALCPVGYKNAFRLPSASVLARYKMLGIHVFRTDMDGTIDVGLPERGGMRVSCYTGRERLFR